MSSLDMKQQSETLTLDSLTEQMRSLTVDSKVPTKKSIFTKYRSLYLEQQEFLQKVTPPRRAKENNGDFSFVSAESFKKESLKKSNCFLKPAHFECPVSPQTKNKVENQEQEKSAEKENVLRKLYFGVKLPDVVMYNEDKFDLTKFDMPLVLENLSLVNKVLVYIKNTRFQRFDTYEDAAKYASTEYTVIKKEDGSNKLTSQQLRIKFRRLIEQGDEKGFLEEVWTKPSLLVAGDTDLPAILHEGTRYNALHIAAKSDKPLMCQLILNTLEDNLFLKKVFPDDKQNISDTRKNRLLDLYINFKDKKLGETPLHLASKFGFLECCVVLVSQPLCDIECKNFSGQTALDVACSRMKIPDEKREILIQNTLQGLELLYVPLFRCEKAAIVRKPCSVKELRYEANTTEHSLEQFALKGFAGPMSLDAAFNFYKLIKNPRNKSVNVTFDEGDEKIVTEIIRTDAQTGLERVARSLSDDLDTQWVEYISFLDRFTNLATRHGVKCLEAYFEKKYREQEYSPEYSQRITKQDESVYDVLHENDPVENPLAHYMNEQLRKKNRTEADPCEESVEEDDDPFFTPPTSPKNEDLREDSPTRQIPLFVEGTKMTRSDMDATLAMGEFEVREREFPFVYRWKQQVQNATRSLKPAEEKALTPLRNVSSPRLVHKNIDPVRCKLIF